MNLMKTSEVKQPSSFFWGYLTLLVSIICSFFFSFLFIKQELFFFLFFFTFSLIVLWIRLICCHQKPVVFSGAFTLQMKVSVGGRWCRTSCQNKQKTNKHTTTFPFRKLLLDITTHSVLLLQSLQFQCCVVVCAAVLLTVSICLPLTVGYLTWHVVHLCTKLNRGCAFFPFLKYLKTIRVLTSSHM